MACGSKYVPLSTRKLEGQAPSHRARTETDLIMKIVKYGLTVGVVVLALQVAVDAAAQGNGHPKAATNVERSGVHGDVRVVFSSQDIRVIREHYAPRYRNLPPGLQKKLARTGQLPPGWQKKMEPLPVALERRLVALPAGYQRGVIDGHALIYRPGTSVIIDATVLF
jgi:hypothetical protein